LVHERLSILQTLKFELITDLQFVWIIYWDDLDGKSKYLSEVLRLRVSDLKQSFDVL